MCMSLHILLEIFKLLDMLSGLDLGTQGRTRSKYLYKHLPG